MGGGGGGGLLRRFLFQQALNLNKAYTYATFRDVRTFKVDFSGPKTFRGFRETGPRPFFLRNMVSANHRLTRRLSWH